MKKLNYFTLPAGNTVKWWKREINYGRNVSKNKVAALLKDLNDKQIAEIVAYYRGLLEKMWSSASFVRERKTELALIEECLAA